MKKTGLLMYCWRPRPGRKTATICQTLRCRCPQGTVPTSASFPVERIQTPTYADLYCAGFISKQSCPMRTSSRADCRRQLPPSLCAATWSTCTARATRAGAEYEIIRALRDLNEYEMFPGQKKR